MKKRRIIYFTLAILFGIFLFVFGGYDDSPGAQMLGLILALTGIIGIFRRKKGKQIPPSEDSKI